MPKVSPFYAQHCPLNSFGHNFNRFCGISFQNLKNRFFAVFWSPNFTWNICKNSKKSTYGPQNWPKTALHISCKSIKLADSTFKPFKNDKIFPALGGQFDPPLPDRVKKQFSSTLNTISKLHLRNIILRAQTHMLYREMKRYKYFQKGGSGVFNMNVYRVWNQGQTDLVVSSLPEGLKNNLEEKTCIPSSIPQR